MANDRVQAKIDLLKGKDETGEVKSSLGSFGSSLSRIGEIAAGLGLERLAENVVQVGKNAASAAVSTGMQFEQWKMGFDTMLGSAEKSSKLLSDISEFAKKTPFELTDIVQSSRQLVAYGFAQEEVIKTTKTLGDISAGVGVPLNDLVYLYGTLRAQNVAYTKDLNQFTARGIPVLDLLSEKFGVTKEKVLDMASKSKIGFKDIEQVFQKMTSSGGVYFNMMDKQSKTMSGVLSNIKDSITQVGLSMLGFDMVIGSKTFGQAKQGSIFDQMAKGAQALLGYLESHKEQINNFTLGVTNALTAIANFLQTKVVPAAQDFYGVLVRIAQHVQTAFTPVMNHLLEVYNKHKQTIDTLVYVLGAVLYGVLVALIHVLGIVTDIWLTMTDFMLTRLAPAISYIADIITSVGTVWDSIVNSMDSMFRSFVNGIIDGVNSIVGAFNKLTNLNVPMLGKIGGSNLSSATAGKNFTPTSFNSGLNYSPALSYTPASSNNSKNISITNNNNFSSSADANAFAKYQAWQISGR